VVKPDAQAWAAAHAGPGVPVVGSPEALPQGPAALCVRNARAASRLLSSLLGAPEGEPAFTEEQIEAALSARGLHAKARGALADAPIALPLPQRATEALRGLLIAAQPQAAAGWLLFAVEPGAAPHEAPPRSDVLSVIVRCDGADPSALDRTIFSLACQHQRPLEIVAAGTDAAAALERHAHLGTFEAAAAPTGRYLAWLAAGDLIYPQHYWVLRGALDATGAAFAASRGRETKGGADFIEAKQTETPLPSDVAGLIRRGSLPSPALLFDRLRVPGLRLNDPALSSSEPGSALARRLLSLCRPAVVEGVPTWERPEQAAAAAAPEEMPLLMTVQDLSESMSRAPAPRWLRYRVADALSEVLHSIKARWRKP
jgi:hypothetical protein